MELFKRVKLKTNKYAEEGVPKGDIGYIIEIYDDGNYEIEFSDNKTGITYAQLIVEPKDVEIYE